MLSAAFALMVIVLLTVEPLAGEVIEVVGGVVSGVLLLTVTLTAADVPTLPAASEAWDVNE
jgi:hypothetical protein